MTLPPSNHVDRKSALRGEAEQEFSLRESGVHLHRGAMSSPAITVKAAEDCPKVASAQTPNSGHAKPKMPKADECRIVITDCDGAEDATDRDSRVAAWLGQDASAASSAIEEGELSRCDSQPRRHHKHRHKRRQRKHHHHRHSSTHSRSSRSDEPTASRCQSSRLVVEVDDDFASECDTIATGRSEGAWSGLAPPDRDERKRKNKRKRKRKRKPGEEIDEDEDSQDGSGKRDKKAEMIVVTVSAVILTIALLLIGITLALTPKIDEMVRKENEVMFRIPTPPPGLLSSTGSVVTVLQENTTMASLTAAG
ncbi:uncharacterized protein LOC142814569 [Rhipicephalus microplus]|uniref:uncharacterized protein LOC142814569 n=1 Tax=Rhipicephalus microplus TaxID=6941 RepID=UPI003F6BCBC9